MTKVISCCFIMTFLCLALNLLQNSHLFGLSIWLNLCFGVFLNSKMGLSALWVVFHPFNQCLATFFYTHLPLRGDWFLTGQLCLKPTHLYVIRWKNLGFSEWQARRVFRVPLTITIVRFSDLSCTDVLALVMSKSHIIYQLWVNAGWWDNHVPLAHTSSPVIIPYPQCNMVQELLMGICWLGSAYVWESTTGNFSSHARIAC